MCLAVPGKVVETLEEHGVRMARVSFGGVLKNACIEHVPDAKPGDYVLVHVGFALSKIDEAEAHKLFALLEELGTLTEELG
jgi:hydrogenase expression/formation protein HypC